jgi:hypothetical protein
MSQIPFTTAYPDDLDRLVGGKVVHIDQSLDELRLRSCELASCLGMCCYDGIYLRAQEANLIPQVASRESAFFAEMGIDLPVDVVVEGRWMEDPPRAKTAVRFRPFSRLVEGYPTHFEDTACVFLADDGRCGLQMLSLARGLHPWHYKPLGCWLHPLDVNSTATDVIVSVSRRADDPEKTESYPGYTTFTECGSERSSALPARLTLAVEISTLIENSSTREEESAGGS